jgi:hypothetical protein
LVALGGVGLLIGFRYLQIDVPGLPEAVRDTLVGLAAAEGVYQVSNGEG